MFIRQENTILLHPGKTGGSSIESFYIKKYYNMTKAEFDRRYVKNGTEEIMYGYCRKYGIYLQHADTRLFRIIGIDIKKFRTISTIRRPYERILSAYYYSGLYKELDFKQFVINRLQKLHDSNDIYSKNYFAPQIFYEADNIIRLETIKHDSISLGVELPDRQHSKSKASEIYTDYMDAYDIQTKNIVYKLYKQDFKRFGY